MKIQFIGQGTSEGQSVGQRLLASLSNGLFDKFTVVSAFASQSAVLSINEVLQKASLTQLTFIVGIDQKGTSKEALEALLSIENADISVIHTISGIIFHPKIYIFEGQKQVCVIVGSSNLTMQGLFQNIEASLIIEFEQSDENGTQILKEVYGFIDALSENRTKLTQELIEKLYESKVIPLESENKETRSNLHQSDKEARDPSVWEQVKTVFPSIKINKIPHQFKFKKSQNVVKEIDEKDVILGESLEFELEHGALVWQKHNLPSSDAQQVKGNSNVTGVLRLGQADYQVEGKLIDKNTYFRQNLFGKLNWKNTPRAKNTPLEDTTAEFDISINNQYFGVFTLKISHNPERISGQANIPTNLHWGSDVIKILKENNVMGKRLSLYMPIEEGKPFTIDIL
jgi:HKD family nuclease